jgi:isopentenyl diphosphate isomerase/L-lactate dehydrogenase-like FMN-dependent dehydrogenase
VDPCKQVSAGEDGVDRVLEIKDTDFTTIMRQVDAPNIDQLTRYNLSRARETDLPRTSLNILIQLRP